MPGHNLILIVEVVEARDINQDLFVGLPYPYCIITCTGRENLKLKTPVAKKTLNPLWNEAFKLNIGDKKPPLGTLIISVYHSRTVGSDELIGHVSVSRNTINDPSGSSPKSFDVPQESNPSDESWSSFPSNGVDMWYNLTPRDKRKQGITDTGNGKVHVRFKLAENPSAHQSQPVPPPSQNQPAENSRSPQLQILLPEVQLQLRNHLKKRELEQQSNQTDADLHAVSPRKTQRLQELQHASNGRDQADTEHKHIQPTSDEQHIASNSHNSGGHNHTAKQKLQRQQPVHFLLQIPPKDQLPTMPETSIVSNTNNINAANDSANGTVENVNHSNSTSKVAALQNSTSISKGSKASGAVNYNSVVVTQVPARELQKTFAETVSTEILQSLDKEERIRQEVILELINTERDYVRDLQILIRVYIERMRDRRILSLQDLESLFTNIEQLLPIHSSLLSKLETRQAHNPVILDLADILLDVLPQMNVYASVCSNQPSVVGKIERFSTAPASTFAPNGSISSAPTNSFKLFLEETILLPEVRALSLMNFLIKPLQRITRYPLLLKEILRHTPSTHPDFASLTDLLGQFMSFVDKVNETTRRSEQELRAIEVQPLLDRGEDLKLVTDKRALIRESDIKLLKMGGSGSIKRIECHALLFDHMLVFATNESNKKKLLHQKEMQVDGENAAISNFKYYTVVAIPLPDLMLSDCLSEKGLVALEVIYVGEAVYSVAFESPEDRLAWVHDIEQAILQHLKNQGKKDLHDLHHIELISNNEVDSLMFKRPLFDKDLTLTMLVPQNLLGVAQPAMTRSGSFNEGNKPTGLGLNLYFGKSHKHKHENVEQTKLFTLEKALRRDLDAFNKALRKQVLELLANKRYLERELQTVRPVADITKQEQHKLEAKVKDLIEEITTLRGCVEQERHNTIAVNKQLEEMELHVEIEKTKSEELEAKLVVALQAVSLAIIEREKSIPSIESSSVVPTTAREHISLATASVSTCDKHVQTNPENEPHINPKSCQSQSTQTQPMQPSLVQQAPTQPEQAALPVQSTQSTQLTQPTQPTQPALPTAPMQPAQATDQEMRSSTPDLLKSIERTQITKTDKTGPKHARTSQQLRQTPSPRNTINSKQTKSSRSQSSLSNSSRSSRHSKQLFSPPSQTSAIKKIAPSIPPKPSRKLNPKAAPKPAVPPKPVIPPKPSVLPVLASKPAIPPNPARTKPFQPKTKPPVPQRPPPPIPQKSTTTNNNNTTAISINSNNNNNNNNQTNTDVKHKTISKHPVPQRPPPPIPQKQLKTNNDKSFQASYNAAQAEGVYDLPNIPVDMRPTSPRPPLSPQSSSSTNHGKPSTSHPSTSSTQTINNPGPKSPERPQPPKPPSNHAPPSKQPASKRLSRPPIPPRVPRTITTAKPPPSKPFAKSTAKSPIASPNLPNLFSHLNTTHSHKLPTKK